MNAPPPAASHDAPAVSPEARACRPHARLQPLIGAATALFIGAGVAIGSGIFRNAGLVAASAATPFWILAAWAAGGFFFLLAGLLTAELATRFRSAGGEYVYLRHAYGDFVAFFFGWAYTVFIIGGGVATMAVAFGEFAANFCGLSGSAFQAGLLGAGVIILITAINLGGLRIGAATQNVLTILKVLVLAAIIVAAAVKGRPIHWFAAQEPAEHATATPMASNEPAGSTNPRHEVDAPDPPPTAAPRTPGVPLPLLAWLGLFAGAMMPVMWCYEGTTDSVKMTEEVRDPRRAMPQALIGAAVLVGGLYLLLNWAFLRVLSPAEMAASKFVPADVLTHWLGAWGGKLTHVLAMAVVLGAISSTIVSCVRVPFALGRDGLTFGFLGRMTAAQAPSAALLTATGVAVLFALTGIYETLLSVYTIAGSVLFGLVNLSLLLFRLRERSAGGAIGEPDHFRCPAGMAVSVFLAMFQFIVAAGTAITLLRAGSLAPLYTLSLLAGFGALYFIWPRRPGGAQFEGRVP